MPLILQRKTSKLIVVILLDDDKKYLEEMLGDLKQRIATLKKARSDIDAFIGDSYGLYS